MVEVLAHPLGSGVVGRAAVVWDALFFCGISLLEMLLEYYTSCLKWSRVILHDGRKLNWAK